MFAISRIKYSAGGSVRLDTLGMAEKKDGACVFMEMTMHMEMYGRLLDLKKEDPFINEINRFGAKPNSVYLIREKDKYVQPVKVMGRDEECERPYVLEDDEDFMLNKQVVSQVSAWYAETETKHVLLAVYKIMEVNLIDSFLPH